MIGSNPVVLSGWYYYKIVVAKVVYFYILPAESGMPSPNHPKTSSHGETRHLNFDTHTMVFLLASYFFDNDISGVHHDYRRSSGQRQYEGGYRDSAGPYL